MRRCSIAFLLYIITLLICFLPNTAFSQQKESIKIGVSSMITPVDTVKYYQEIIDYIGEQIKQPVQMVHRRTYDEMDTLLERGEVTVAFICSASYVKDHDTFGVELLVAPSVNKKTTYHSYIIAHKDSPFHSFPELKGRTFAFTDPKSNSGYLYPLYLLKTMESNPESFFKKYIYSYSHNKSVELVAKRIVDGASVDSLVYENMLKKSSPYAKQVKVIKRSAPFGIPPVVVTKEIDPSIREKIKQAFLKMHKTPKGKLILSAMMIDGFVQISDQAYDSIRKMERSAASRATAATSAKGRQTVYFGIVPRDNPRILYEKYQPLLDYLSERTAYAFELSIKKNYEETVSALGNGTIDIALLGSLTYLEAYAKYGALCILKPKGLEGNATYRSIIIKRRGSPIKSLAELKGKRVAFSAVKSTSGNLIPRYLIANAGLHLQDLGKYANFDYHDSVVKAILNGQYDAGAVRDSVVKKYSKLGIESIAESESIPIGPLVAGTRTPFAVVESVKRALLELNPKDPAHAKLLKKLDDDLRNGFTEALDSDYAGIRSKINAVPSTCGKGCHPKLKL